MFITDVYSADFIAAYMTEAVSNSEPFLGSAYFPDKKKMGIDLQWLKSHKGLGVTLKASTFDAIPTVRQRERAKLTKEQMPLFRQSIDIKETDLMELARIREKNDPFLQPVIDSMYDDTRNLIEGADIAAEKMRMSLIAPQNGEVKISINDDNAIYEYDYDSDGTWKRDHYMELTGTDTWDNPTTAKPLTDLRKAVQFLSSVGVTATSLIGNSATFDYLTDNEQVKSAIVTLTGAPVGYMDETTIEDVIRRRVRLNWIPYDKMYKNDLNGPEYKFYPDDYVTIVGRGQLGNTWRGTTPEELTTIGNFMDIPQAPVDITVLPSGVAVAVQTVYKPSFTVTTTASQIALPSFEGMDSIYVIKVK